MMIRQFSEEEQAIFRKVMDAKGGDKEAAICEIIEKKLDEESAIVSWLKRIHEFDLYKRLKNEPNDINHS